MTNDSCAARCALRSRLSAGETENTATCTESRGCSATEAPVAAATP
jgi:hypothetical protein